MHGGINGGDKFQFTWKKRKPLIMSRLDYFLLPMGTFMSVRECVILPAVLSDHSPVLLKLSFSNLLKGPGTWKFNVKHLQNKEFCDEVNKIIDFSHFRYNNLNPLNRWEMTKHDIRQFAIQYSRRQSFLRKEKLKRLEAKLKQQEKKLAMINLSSDSAIDWIEKINGKIDEVKIELQKYYLDQAQGAILRSKVRWTESAEKSTSYFLGLERQHSKSKIMNKTMTEVGTVTEDPQEILQIQARFYEKLYKSNKNIECKINIEPERKLSDQERNDIDKPITVDEIKNAIKNSATKKSPGTDGFSIDLYIVFWVRLESLLFDAYNYAFNEGMLNDSARRGIISLIPKKGRNLDFVKHWRPIILLNSDYKILSKVIATRIKSVLGGLIGSPQTGFLQGRNISENLRKLLDAIEFTDNENVPCLLLSIDFQKAFDRVEYSSLFKIMSWFGFGDQIIKWVKILFSHINLATINNGTTSKYFKTSRALFQGNPIASYLFILVIELLAVQLRKNNKIKGLKIDNQELLMVLFADDVGLLLEFEKEVLDETVYELDKFQNQTGMIINYEKTEIYRMGSIKKTNAHFYTSNKMHWTNEPLKILGVILSEDCHVQNIEPIIKQAECILKMWRRRNLSLNGKIQILNSLIGSLFVYKLAVLPVLPEHYIQIIELLFNDFIWNGRRPKIRLNILQGLKEDGGADLVNIKTRDAALKIQWVMKAMNDPLLQAFACKQIGVDLGFDIWQIAMNEKHFVLFFKNKNFWSDVLKVWSSFRCKFGYENENASEHFLWFNSKILIDKKPVFYKKWYDVGVRNISDMLSVNSTFMSFESFQLKYGIKVIYTHYVGLKKAIITHFGTRIV